MGVVAAHALPGQELRHAGSDYRGAVPANVPAAAGMTLVPAVSWNDFDAVSEETDDPEVWTEDEENEYYMEPVEPPVKKGRGRPKKVTV